MIRGRVNQRLEPLASVSILDGRDIAHSFEFIVDTGFNGHLTLPADVINRLGLNYSGQRAVATADGFTHNVDVFTARVLLHEHPQACIRHTFGKSTSARNARPYWDASCP